MIKTVYINLWDKRVGAVAWDNSAGVGSVEFEPSFFSNQWDLAPVQMPLRQAGRRVFTFPGLRESKAFKGLPGLLADSLPDRYGHTLINAWLSRRGRPADSMNPVETLCFIGKRGMGALEFEPAIPGESNQSSTIEINDLVHIANEILAGRQKFATDLTKNEEKALVDILKIGTSAAGARAKAVVAFNAKTLEIRSGQTLAPEGFTQWLIKFDGVADTHFGSGSGYGRVEMAYHLMAVDAGIDMTECRLLEENERAHFMTRRFDREPGNTKIHVQSFCAMQHFDFNNIESYSYEQLFETMRLLGLPYPQAEELFRRMVFNVLSRNCDDHTRNFAFLMDKSGIWKLSPAFDLCHSYRPESAWVSRQSLSVNGKREKITRDDLLSVARAMNIKKAAAIVNQINAVVENWPGYAETTNVNSSLRDAIAKTLIILTPQY